MNTIVDLLTISNIYLNLEFSMLNFKIAVSQEWEGRSTWNEKDMNR